MGFKQCSKGHYYDDKEAMCPVCSGQQPIGVTIPLNADANFDPSAVGGLGATEILKTVGFATPSENIGKTEPITGDSFGRTEFVSSSKNSDVLPVSGWLVVIEGKKCGLDFRIHTGDNTIGRSSSNAICMDFDNAISKEKACLVNYDERHNSFYIIKGDTSTNNIYVNDEILLAPKKLNDNDIIEIGETKLIFRALCNDQFKY